MEIINNKPRVGLNPSDVYDKLIKGENVFIEFKEYNRSPEIVRNSRLHDMFMCPNTGSKLSESKLSVVWFSNGGIFVKEEDLNANVIDFYLDDRVIMGISVIESFDRLRFTTKEYLTGDNVD